MATEKEAVESKLKKVHEILVTRKEEGNVFREYAEPWVIGGYIYKALLGRMNGGNDEDSFYLMEKRNEAGLVSQLYGLTGLLSAISRFDIYTSDVENKKPSEKDKKQDGKDENQKKIDLLRKQIVDEKKADIKKIKEGLKQVLAYIDVKGYDASPLLESKINEKLFSVKDKKISYIGARTWALALFFAVLRVDRDKDNGFDFSPAEIDKVKEEIKKNIEFFVDNVIREGENKDGKAIGYGYVEGCTEPSLFFTYSVLEAFSDFEDAVLTVGREHEEYKNNFLKGLNDGNKRVEGLEKLFQKICEDIGDRAWDIFGDKLKNSFVNDTFDKKKLRIISKDEIENSSRSSALFNNLYAIFILIYSRKNQRAGQAEGEKEQEKAKKEQENVETVMSQGLQLIQNFNDDLAAIGKDNIVEKHIIAFDQKLKSEDDSFSRELNYADIQASSLLPMLIKATNLVAFHINKFPQQKMGKLLDSMFKAKLDGDEWLWEGRKFDLLSTERYLEAIADFYDYYGEYEKQYVEKALNKAEQTRRIRDEIYDKEYSGIKADEEKRVKADHKKALEDARKEERDAVLKGYTIEKAIRNRIAEEVPRLLCETLNALSEYNRASPSKKPNLEEREDAVRKALKEYIESYFTRALEKSWMDGRAPYGKNEEDQDQKKSDLANFQEESKKDFYQSLRSFFDFIKKNKISEKSDRSLKDIFKTIESKEG